MAQRTRTFSFILALALALGCSKGLSPSAPGLRDTADERIPALNQYLWGAWDIVLDPASRTASIEPLRHAQLTVNIVRFLQPPAQTTNLLKIQIDPDSNFTTGHIILDVILMHPFPGHDTFCGFDVRGVVIGDGSIAGKAHSGILYAGPNDLRLLNPDGLTRWFNPTEFTTYGKIFGFTQGARGTPSNDFSATLNPYKYFCTGLNSNDDLASFFNNPSCPNPRGLFSSTSTLRRRYDLQFKVTGVPQYRFQYAVVASWEPPDPLPPVSIPDDFPISANCHEAFCVSSADNSYLYYASPTERGGTLDIVVRVFDHQGAALPGGVSEQVKAVHLETDDGLIPGNLASYQSAALEAALVGEDAISATYRFQIFNPLPSALGTFNLLVAVESASPDSYFQGVPGVAIPEAPLAAYFVVPVKVKHTGPEAEPVALACVATPEPFCTGVPVQFDASASYDPDGGAIELYEWDFDGDGVYGDPFDSGTPVQPARIFSSAKQYKVDLKVTDDEGDFDTLTVKFTIDAKSGEVWVDDDNVSGPWDGSFDHPYRTVQDGIDNVEPACGPGGKGLVHVNAGTYEENIVMKDNVVIEGVSDPAPLLTNPEGSDQPLVDLRNKYGCTVRHFRCKPRTTSFCVVFSKSQSNTMDDLEFLDNPGGDTCLYAVYGNDTFDCVVNNMRANGIIRKTCGFIRVSGSNLTVTNCVILNLEWVVACPMATFQVMQEDKPCLVAKNVVGNCTMKAAPAVYPVRAFDVRRAQGTDGTVVRNNLVFNITSELAGGLTMGIHANPAGGFLLEHNTVVGIHGPEVTDGFLMSDSVADPAGCESRDHVVADVFSATPGLAVGYNGLWTGDLPVSYSCVWNVENNFGGSIVPGFGMVYADPQFMDPSNNDYRLKPESPCHNAASDGTDMGAYGGSDPLTWLP